MFRLTRVSVFAAALLPLTALGPAQARHSKHYPYKLTVLATLGGPQADIGNGPYINPAGVVTGTSDIAHADPYGKHDNGSFNGDPRVQHTYLWRNGVLKDLGALAAQPAKNSSYPNAINARGDLAGISDNGAIDPLTHTAEADAVLWKDGQVTNLGTLGGNESQAFGMNDADQVTGLAATATPDRFSMLGSKTQAHAFLWQAGTMRDLGTLGGPDSFGWYVSARGQVVGVSDTSAIPNRVTGQPPSSVFLWQHGKMRDIGNLGGSTPAFGGVAGVNNRGEIVGQSDLAGDKRTHPFVWNGIRMIDLGTLGGQNGLANGINQQGVVVGAAQTSANTFHGFLWHNGKMTDLAPVNHAHWAFGNNVNDRDVVVGTETDSKGNNPFAVLWTGGRAYNLNKLIAPSQLRLTNAVTINDRGQIIGEGRLRNGDVRNFLLVPNNH